MLNGYNNFIACIKTEGIYVEVAEKVEIKN